MKDCVCVTRAPATTPYMVWADKMNIALRDHGIRIGRYFHDASWEGFHGTMPDLLTSYTDPQDVLNFLMPRFKTLQAQDR